MSFQDFLGNNALVESLQKQLASHRLPHSLLFAGPEGVGKATLARCLAKAVNCPHSEETDFCGHCPSCRKIDAQSHPDVKEIEPDGQFIKIEQTRDLSKEAFFHPFEGKRRIFILNQAERLKLEAANSLLKTLEEPPETSHLILISSQPDDLLGTIRSRTQLYRFAPLPADAIAKLLRQKGDFSASQLDLMARISGGSVGRALSLDIDAYREERQHLVDFLSTLATDFSYHQASRFLGPWSREKGLFQSKAEILFGLIRDLLLLQIDGDCALITNCDLRQKMSQLASTLPRRNLIAAAKVLDHMETGAKRNLNKGLALDQLAFRLGGQF